jgi:hypothetical protein
LSSRARVGVVRNRPMRQFQKRVGTDGLNRVAPKLPPNLHGARSEDHYRSRRALVGSSDRLPRAHRPGELDSTDEELPWEVRIMEDRESREGLACSPHSRWNRPPSRRRFCQTENRLPTSLHTVISPAPLTSMTPRDCMSKLDSTSRRVASVTWIVPSAAVDSMRLAMLTVSPHKS